MAISKAALDGNAISGALTEGGGKASSNAIAGGSGEARGAALAVKGGESQTIAQSKDGTAKGVAYSDGGKAESNTSSGGDSFSNAMVNDDSPDAGTPQKAEDVEKMMSDAMNLRVGSGFENGVVG